MKLTLISASCEQAVVDVQSVWNKGKLEGIGDFDVSTGLSAQQRSHDCPTSKESA
jgi:hypothetical protein